MQPPSLPHLFGQLKESDNCARLHKAFALSQFAEKVRYSPTYEPDTRWSTCLTLTSEGDAAKAEAMAKNSLPAPAVNMAMFGHFYHRGLLIDPDASDLDVITELLQNDLLERRCSFIPFHGRALYDAFNRIHPAGHIAELDANQAYALLQEVGCGVCQFNNTVFGPLGILQSQSIRWLDIASSPPLWHSRDSDGIKKHRVQFVPPDISLVRAYEAINTVLGTSGSAGPWSAALLKHLFHDTRHPPGFGIELARIVAECTVEADLRAMLTVALKTPAGKGLRELLSSPPRKKGRGEGSPESVSAQCSSNEIIQLLLTLSDELLTEVVDHACQAGLLTLEENEVRRPPDEWRFYFHFSVSPSIDIYSSALSVHGVQITTKPPGVTLARLIREGYAKDGALADLSWKLRVNESASHAIAMNECLHKEGPERLFERLVLPTQPVAEYVARELLMSPGAARDASFLSRVLWKVGFTQPALNAELTSAASHLQQFEQAVLGSPPLLTEFARDEIRKNGVNLWVHLEGFLEKIVGFTCWSFGLDHTSPENARFNERRACDSVSSVLGSEIVTSDGAVLPWDAGGRNTFNVLLAYLNASGRWLEDAASGRLVPAQKEFPESELGHSRRELALKHKQLWADCSRPMLESYSSKLSEFIRLVNAASIPSVRNGLDHKRDRADFPPIDAMISLASRMRRAFEIADASGLYPKRWALQSRGSSRTGRSWFSMVDYRGQSRTIFGPPHLSGLNRSINYANEYIIFPTLFDAADSDLVFPVDVESALTRLWAGYPTIRRI